VKEGIICIISHPHRPKTVSTEIRSVGKHARGLKRPQQARAAAQRLALASAPAHWALISREMDHPPRVVMEMVELIFTQVICTFWNISTRLCENKEPCLAVLIFTSCTKLERGSQNHPTTWEQCMALAVALAVALKYYLHTKGSAWPFWAVLNCITKKYSTKYGDF
jgi:hypothetical protein